jgi:hypothetical protein
MQKINGLGDLERYGIVPLTGEACGLMYRVLFDVTAEGKRILEKCFGLSRLTLDDSWNRGTAEHPHIGSIMIAPEMLPAIGIFALLEHGCSEVWRKGDVLYGVELSDPPEQVERLKRNDSHLRRFAYQGTAGDRNIHQMTGRVR